jgi:flagellar biosynthesis GTPase FlhF
MLKALDAHGKNDKNLQPTQWMCGLAGSIAAFAEAKSELASANSFMGELMTLRKESIQLRTRNAVLERELAEMETRLPAGGANSGAMGLPKAKKRGFGAAPKETNTPPPTPTPSFDEEERLQRQQQKIQQQQEEEAEAATAAAAAAAAATREEEERQRQEREAVEAQRRREDREEEEEKERQRKEQEAAEAQRRQHEEAEALRTQREAEAAANIPPPPVEDEDPNLTFWSAHENQGKTYYYNSQTRESTYEKPVGFSEPEKVKNESPHVEL